MCGRFVLMTPGRDLAERFGPEEIPDLQPRYNIAPTQVIVVIRLDRDTLQRRLVQMKSGLIPFWAKDTSIGPRLINARGESAAEKPAFRAAFKSRRRLVLTDSFYQWKGTFYFVCISSWAVPRCNGSKRGSKSLRWKLAQFLAWSPFAIKVGLQVRKNHKKVECTVFPFMSIHMFAYVECKKKFHLTSDQQSSP